MLHHNEDDVVRLRNATTGTGSVATMDPLSVEQDESHHGTAAPSLTSSSSYGSLPGDRTAADAGVDNDDDHVNVIVDESGGGAVQRENLVARAPHHGGGRDNSNNNNNKKLGVVGLAVIVFYSVSGGPFGVEPAVRSAGNLYALLGFCLLPVLWSAPEAFMTAELGAALPEAAGGVAWTELAFGPRAGWLCGYLSWVSGATDNAIYPVLFLDYVVAAFEVDDTSVNSLTRWFWLATCSSVLAYVNWLGLPTVGKMSIVICVIAMSPFVILCLVGVFQVQPHRWFQIPEHIASPNDDMMNNADDDDANNYDDDDPHRLLASFLSPSSLSVVHWAPFLNNLFWNGNSFDSSASFAGDVNQPGRVFPRALAYSVVLVTAGYLVPLLVALGASDAPPEAWVDGYLAKAAHDIVGPWLGGWTVLAAGISNIAMFQAELSSDAFQLMGMADRGYLPPIFSIRSRHGTPTYGIVLGAVVIVLMTLSDLEGLIEMLNFQYAIALLMEYAAFLKLRVSHPDLHRPYRIPLGTTGCFLLFLPPIVMTIGIMTLASTSTLVFSLVVNAFGIALYQCTKGRKRSYDHYLTVTTDLTA